jgi:hypothetical protein
MYSLVFDALNQVGCNFFGKKNENVIVSDRWALGKIGVT